MPTDIDQLNHSDRQTRLAAASRIATGLSSRTDILPPSEEVNNHVHSFYSFSPYSPTKIAFMALKSGLQAVGVMDHDSVSGGEEMLEAGKIFGMATTVGFEMRVNFDGAPYSGRKLNNPDSENLVYIALHGIPRQHLGECADFLKPVQHHRNRRNRCQVEKLNGLLAGTGLQPLDFDRDVWTISKAAEGGSITERHILAALAGSLIQHTGGGVRLTQFVREKLKTEIPAKLATLLEDPANPHLVYDLLGILKASFLPGFFIQPNNEECLSVFSAIDFAHHVNAIPVYAYLGDIAESPTGDKKAEKFEDEFLDGLVPELKNLGFQAITYMPPRNTVPQLLRLQALCRASGLMEISGVDINSSRQSFRCPEILMPECRHLNESTWALIAHEKLASGDERFAFFHPDNPFAGDSLAERLRRYAAVGVRIDRHQPETAFKLL
jgi:hypothetical protein